MKHTFLIVSMLVCGIVAKAQGAFSIGPKVGYDTHTLTTNQDSIQADAKNSFQVGAFVRVGKKFYFQPEANYQVSKSTLNKSLSSTIQSQDVTLKSIKIPALLGFKLINKGRFNVRIMAGPAISFILDKKLNPSQMNELWPINSTDDIKNSVWSAQMGAGIDALFLTLDVRYEVGIDDLYSGSKNLDLKNNMFNVSLGIKLL